MVSRRAWKRTTAAPLFSKFHLIVLSAVLLGVEGKDGECKNSPRASLGKILFPEVPESTATLRVDRALNDRVVDRLIAVFDQDIPLLPTQEDREFVWRVKQRYPAGIKGFGEAVYNFGVGKGLPPYKLAKVPWHEIEPKREIGLKREEKPIAPNWASSGSGQERLAKRFPPAVVPRVAASRSIFDCVHIVLPRADGGCGREFHDWEETVSIPSIVQLACPVCGATGDILQTPSSTAQQKWVKLQEAMHERDNKAA